MIFFELKEEETKMICSRFQIGTLNSKNNLRGMHQKYMPHAFTEQGVAMLASILHTSVAEEVSISIIRAFVAMRKYISNDLYQKNYILNNQKNRLLQLEKKFDKMPEKQKINTIFYNGQI